MTVRNLIKECALVVDCETGGTDSTTCPIYSTAVVPIFPRYTAEGNLYDLRIGRKHAFYFEGRVQELELNPMDETTEAWYRKNDLDSWLEFLPTRDILTLWQNFHEWMSRVVPISPSKCTLWANDPSFDRVLLDRMSREIELKVPGIKGLPLPPYWNNRCVRTAKASLPKGVTLPSFEGTKHNALDDAAHEAEIVHKFAMYLAEANATHEKKKNTKTL